MILEFTGLSGAGKSTSEPYMISGLKQRGFEVVVRSELKKYYYKKIICPNFEVNDGLFFKQLTRLAQWNALKSVGLGRQFFLNALSKRCRDAFLWLSEDIILSKYFSQEYKASGSGSSVYISQEGFVHHCALMMLYGRSNFSGLFKKITQIFPKEEITIIHFKIPVEEALDRLLKRKRGVPRSWPRTINSRSKVKEFLFSFNEVIEEVVKMCQAEGIQVLNIDNSFDLNQLQPKIENVLDKLSHNGKNGGTEQKLFT